jgi:hypothetical protein
MKCDLCNAEMLGWSEIKFAADPWADFLATFEHISKAPEAGAIVFRFCAPCVFDNLGADADEGRLVELVKQLLGLPAVQRVIQ